MKELMNKMGVGNEEDKLNAKHKPDFFFLLKTDM